MESGFSKGIGCPCIALFLPLYFLLQERGCLVYKHKMLYVRPFPKMNQIVQYIRIR